jgi:hypothetical protein
LPLAITLLVVAAATLGGVCTPPPVVWPIGGASHPEAGSNRLGGHASIGGLESAGSPVGDIGAEYAHQLTETVAIGVTAASILCDGCDGGPAMRGVTQVQLIDDRLALKGGLGLGALGGDFYGSADIGLSGSLYAGKAELYLAPVFGIGLSIDDVDFSTWYAGGLFGCTMPVGERVSLGGELGLATFNNVGANGRPSYGGGGTLYLRYVWLARRWRPVAEETGTQ